MTKHVHDATPASDRPAADIEITEEMEEAGAEAIRSWLIADDQLILFGRRAARDAFLAMSKLRSNTP